MTQAQPTVRVQAELTARVFAIGARTQRDTAGSIAMEIDAIRRIARANGLYPAAAVAQALESALGRGERGPLIDGWLAILRDAVGCERHDAAACETFAAACSVRLTA
ncbi:MAG: hypothetical protein WC804_06840 [Sphingomonas sp.]|jgi:hypothetical protein|uniref:hypothetical protein n=1 Tax=Sphingomonas sp. TaxID=28214 RepID=UPI0035687899